MNEETLNKRQYPPPVTFFEAVLYASSNGIVSESSNILRGDCYDKSYVVLELGNGDKVFFITECALDLGEHTPGDGIQLPRAYIIKTRKS